MRLQPEHSWSALAKCGAHSMAGESGEEGKEGKVYSLISVTNNKFSRAATQIVSVGRSYAVHIPHIPHIPRGSGELIEHDFGVGILDDWIQPTPRFCSSRSGREVSGSARRSLVKLAVGQLEATDLGRRRLDLDLNGIFDGPI